MKENRYRIVWSRSFPEMIINGYYIVPVSRIKLWEERRKGNSLIIQSEVEGLLPGIFFGLVDPHTTPIIIGLKFHLL